MGYKNLGLMSAFPIGTNTDALEEPDLMECPSEYKIIDLPIVQNPPLDTLAVFKTKIYRFDQEDNEWKRMCSGNFKFIKNQGYIYVAAYQSGTFLNRIAEVIFDNQEFYNLSISQEFENNWTYMNTKGQKLSVAIQSGHNGKFEQFYQEWNSAKAHNTSFREHNWINQIEPALFDDL